MRDVASNNRCNDIEVVVGKSMSRLKNSSQMLGVCLLSVLLMSAPGCLENSSSSSVSGLFGPCDSFDTGLNNSTNESVVSEFDGATSEVSLLISHAAD